MKNIYGSYGGIITGILGSLYTVFMLGSQLVALGVICKLFMGWSTTFSIVVIGSFIIFYSSFGGIRSVTITDVLQFVLLVIAIPLITNIAIIKVGGMKARFFFITKRRNIPIFISAFSDLNRLMAKCC